VGPHTLIALQSKIDATVEALSYRAVWPIDAEPFQPVRKDHKASLQVFGGPEPHELASGVQHHRVHDKLRVRMGTEQVLGRQRLQLADQPVPTSPVDTHHTLKTGAVEHVF